MILKVDEVIDVHSAACWVAVASLMAGILNLVYVNACQRVQLAYASHLWPPPRCQR
jgi:hypothetical protein